MANIYKTYDWETYKFAIQRQIEELGHAEPLVVYFYDMAGGFDQLTVDPFSLHRTPNPERFDGWVLNSEMVGRLEKENKGENVLMAYTKSEKMELFNVDSVELVTFQLDGKTKYLPAQFFVLSDYLYNLFNKGSTKTGSFSFESTLTDSEIKWLDKKISEWKKYYKNDIFPKGAFWENIFKWYSNNYGEVPKWHSNQANRAYDLDNKFGRRRLNERLTLGGEMNFNDDIDELINSISADPLSEDYFAAQRAVDTSTRASNGAGINKTKEKKMTNTIGNVKNVVVDEFKELVNTSGAADIALGRMLYNNIKATMGRTVVKIGIVDRMVAKVSKKMKYKNEVTELIGVLTALVVLKQFYDHKALENVRGYIVNRLYTIGIEATGFDDVLALMKQVDTQAIND